jgi:hypothetical protein
MCLAWQKPSLPLFPFFFDPVGVEGERRTHQPSLTRPANSVPPDACGCRAHGHEREKEGTGAIQEENLKLLLARTADLKRREMHLARLNTSSLFNIR